MSQRIRAFFGLGAAQQPKPSTTKAIGDAGEDLAIAHLQAAGLTLVARNVKTKGRGGGEVDLVMQEAGCLVFVEVRARASAHAGGAAASITKTKQRRVALAARYYLQQRYGARPLPTCRFDVVTIEAEKLTWIKAAFDAG